MQRRGFAKRLASVIIGGILGAVPLGAGLAFLLDPLRRRRQGWGFVRVASLDVLPVGVPKRFTISGTQIDAWNTYPNEPIGAVYLTRQPDDKVLAFQVVCPHAGCSVEYHRSSKLFRCPCHNSTFKLDGETANPSNPAARGLDALEVTIDEKGNISVRFQEFAQGKEEQIPLS